MRMVSAFYRDFLVTVFSGFILCFIVFYPASSLATDQTIVSTTAADYDESILPTPFIQRAEIHNFIDEMVKRHGFDQNQLYTWFAAIQVRDDILAKISRPAEKTKPWHEYRAIFLDDQRINNGVIFWQTYQTQLALAERQYGVPAEIIIAILGVETRYGRVTGNDKVMEALATIAFAYPKRAAFFRKELEHYLLLTREEGIDPLALTGSYAGAMGLAQFMPSSYRSYAVDFDGDGRRDLWQNPADAIGSIAHYLSQHRWQPGDPIAIGATVEGDAYQKFIRADLKPPQYSVKQLQSNNVFPSVPLTPADQQRQAMLLEFNGQQGMEYWLGFNNFYVITRYNHSPLYAMAVYHLSWEIRHRYGV